MKQVNVETLTTNKGDVGSAWSYNKGGGGISTEEMALRTGPSGPISLSTTVADQAFKNCVNITSVEINSNVETSIGTEAFAKCTGMTRFFGPKVSTAGNYSMYRCTSLETAVIFKVTTSFAFAECSNLLACDYTNTSSSPTIWGAAFQKCTKIKTIVLRSPDSVVGLQSTSALQNTPFDNGGSGGTIYIPKALFDHLGDGTSLDYKAATNWSTFDSYGTITWAKIEGSVYDGYWADGTPIT